MDAGVVIQSSVTHRVKFALESIDIIDDWMNRVEKQLQDIEQGMSHDASPQLKEVSLIVLIKVHGQCFTSIPI